MDHSGSEEKGSVGAAQDAIERARMLRERREAEQRQKLQELQEQAAAAQLQREKREEERRQRQQWMRTKDEERRQQVEQRKRELCEATETRREALLQRDRERAERIERSRQNRSNHRSPFAFGSSTPRTFDLRDMMGFNWAARRAASTTNVMTASASNLQTSVTPSFSFVLTEAEKDEGEKRRATPSSVARRRTDLLPTTPSRLTGRAFSMTRLDKIPNQRPLHSASPSMHHLNRTHWRSGDTSPNSRPGSALSSTGTSVRRTTSLRSTRPTSVAGVSRREGSDLRSGDTSPNTNAQSSTGTNIRRTTSLRVPRPISVAGTGVNTPKGLINSAGHSAAATPTVSRDNTVATDMVQRRVTAAPRKPRPVSAHNLKSSSAVPGLVEHKPPPYKKEKSPRNQVNPVEVTQKLEKLKKRLDLSETPSSHGNNDKQTQHTNTADIAIEVGVETKLEPKPDVKNDEVKEADKAVEKNEEKLAEKKDEKRETSLEKKDETDVMTASMTKRITTEEEAKAALAERRRKAREELEKQAELEKQRIKEEEEAEARRLMEEEERLRKEEEETLELARLHRQMEEEKLQKAMEEQMRAKQEEAERLAREEKERLARIKEEEEKRKAAEEAKLRREQEELERIIRKQRVEAIMTTIRTRHYKQNVQEAQKKLDEMNATRGAQTQQAPTKDIAIEVKNDGVEYSLASSQTDNGNKTTGDLHFATSQSSANNPSKSNVNAATVEATQPNNGNIDVNVVSDQNNTEDLTQEKMLPNIEIHISPNANSNNTEVPVTNNGNLPHVMGTSMGHISTDFIQTERLSSEHNQKLPENKSKLLQDDFTAHNGHGTAHDNSLLTLDN